MELREVMGRRRSVRFIKPYKAVEPERIQVMFEAARMLLLQTVGYPLEHWETGGQRPRLPFDELFHMNKYGESFPRDQKVVEELEKDGMFTRPAPLPEREEELQFLKNVLGLKEPAVL